MIPEYKPDNETNQIGQPKNTAQEAIDVKALETINMNLMRKLAGLEQGSQAILELKAEIVKNNQEIDRIRKTQDTKYKVANDESGWNTPFITDGDPDKRGNR
jgi:hypothetical protein